MQTLNNAELAFLSVLGHTELTTKVLRVYASKIYLFAPLFNPHLNVMWDAYVSLLTKYRDKYGLSLSPDITAAGIAEAVQNDLRIPQDLKQRCDTILQKLLAGDIPDLEHGTRLIKNLMELDANRKMVSKINENADMIALQQTLEASKRNMQLLDDAKPAEDNRLGWIYKPLRDIKKLAVHVERIPTGINWLDDISSGGGRPGELWLILGPSGGGKSMLTVQYACGQAIIGNDTMWATYEQTLEGDLSERMIANITDTSLDQIRDVGFENIPQEVQNKFWASVGGVDDRLTAFDMTKAELDPSDPDDYGAAYTLGKMVRMLKESGSNPKTLIIDWFEPMLSKVAVAKGKSLEECYRFLAQEEILKLQAVAKKENMLIIVLHQLDTKGCNARPTYLANATQAQNMHNMQNFFDMVAILGVKDVNNICYFSNPKGRKGGRIVRTLRLIGDRAKFVMEDGWLPNSDGNFYKLGNTVGSSDVKGAAEKYTRELD